MNPKQPRLPRSSGLRVMDDGAATETVSVGGAVCDQHTVMALPQQRRCVLAVPGVLALPRQRLCVLAKLGVVALPQPCTSPRALSPRQHRTKHTRVTTPARARANTPARVTRPWRPAAAAPPPADRQMYYEYLCQSLQQC